MIEKLADILSLIDERILAEQRLLEHLRSHNPHPSKDYQKLIGESITKLNYFEELKNVQEKLIGAYEYEEDQRSCT